MRMTDLDHVAALLVAFDPMRGDRPPSTRDDAVRWIEWQERNHAEHGFGLWVVETHDGAVVGDCGLAVPVRRYDGRTVGALHITGTVDDPPQRHLAMLQEAATNLRQQLI